MSVNRISVTSARILGARPPPPGPFVLITPPPPRERPRTWSPAVSVLNPSSRPPPRNGEGEKASGVSSLRGEDQDHACPLLLPLSASAGGTRASGSARGGGQD